MLRKPLAGTKKRRRAVRSGRSVSVAFVLTVLAACSSTSAPKSAPSSSSPPQLTVKSTLDGLTALPERIHWQATPSADATEVDFLIDSKLGWVEKNAPYFYGDDGNWLVTSFLAPGQHTFTVKAMGATGGTATDTVTATVTAPAAPPAALAGSWTHVVTAADVTKSTSGMPPPTGKWGVTISSLGWKMRDPQNGGGAFDVEYPSAGHLQMRPTIETPPYPNPSNGGFCENTDPLSTWIYSISNGGKTLVLHPVGKDPCGDRVAILEGTWTRVGK
jgi:hypothetical protein